MRRTTKALQLLLGLCVSCGGDLDTGSSGRAPAVDGSLSQGEPCPESLPKIGDRCPNDFPEVDICTYQVDECTAPNGQNYPDFNNLCCRMGLWQSCGGMSECDRWDAGLPAPDATTAGGPDAGDASTDGTLVPDGAVGPDRPDSAEPDAS